MTSQVGTGGPYNKAKPEEGRFVDNCFRLGERCTRTVLPSHSVLCRLRCGSGVDIGGPTMIA